MTCLLPDPLRRPYDLALRHRNPSGKLFGYLRFELQLNLRFSRLPYPDQATQGVRDDGTYRQSLNDNGNSVNEASVCRALNQGSGFSARDPGDRTQLFL